MVNGFALGGGNELAMVCDFIFTSENSEFGQPEIERGFLPGWGGTQRLPRRVGLSQAKKIIFTGDRISAKEAERIGLADVMVPMDKLEGATMEFAQKLASKAPLAIKRIKEVMNKGIDTDLKSGLRLEMEARDFLVTSEDFKEGVTSFFGEHAICARQVQLAQDMTSAYRLTMREKHLSAALPGHQHIFCSVLHPAAELGANRHTFFGESNSGSKDSFR
jgi:enoyl-CoA hydratase/carnithine racemase